MFVWLFIYSSFFCFNHRRIPKGSFTQNFVKIGLDLAEILRISKLRLVWRRREEEGKGIRRGEILLCNGLILGHPQKYILNILWRSDFIWLRYLRSKKNVCLFVCLFVCLLNCLFFYFNHLRIHTGIYPEIFMRIRLNLSEILRI